MTLSDTGWEGFGEHVYRFEAPDVVHIRNVGDVALEDMQRMFELIRAARAQVGGLVFWLSDITQMGHVRAEARKLAIESDTNKNLRGTAIYGGNFKQRAIANLAIKAARVLRPSRVLTPFKFVATEAEARAYIEAIRCGTQGVASRGSRPPPVH
ncbi:STAS/SEC14 domain-containing protein [Polyangium sorediatum]|uniref:Uncharacterized protein n=1 Tax=Polyangium sorediatum TaxID=889274 RepID=A0ABT6NZY9_9BACT|nr:STAS/SEC14 domain-containing protein [Polyangium sorediatum]MDI1433915.1 hypothetical protein [Polyangium sorediatum]